MMHTRNLPRRSMSLLDRVNKSDIEEKSLSNDESPLPTCPRQPPDGVETPSETVEKIPDLPTRLPPSRLSAGWNNTRPRYSYTSRTQDARSEASVKDKIAMFSVETASPDCVDKCSTLPTRSYSAVRTNVTPYKSNYIEVSSLDRRLTKSQDNLDETPRSFKRQTERPEVLGALKPTSPSIVSKPLNKSTISDKPLFYGSTTNLQSDSSFMRPVYHARSISDDTTKKDVSSHKSNLEYLIEQRKKSMSKLRGLVIPEVQTPIAGLPEIKVKDSFSEMYLPSSKYSDAQKQQKTIDNGRYSISETKWKSNLLPNNIPKYSPAFKRKSLQVYTSLSKEPTPERNILNKTEISSKIISSPPVLNGMKKSFDYSKTPSYKTSNYLSSKDYNKNSINNISAQDFKNVEIKVCTTTDVIDSDNDSAMSSTQSSYRSSASSPMYTLDTIESDSSRLSPRVTNYSTYSMVKHENPIKTYVAEKVISDDFLKRKVCRSMSSDTNISLSSSAGSAATSGSQASCSSLESSVADSDKRKVSKTYNVDTINRRNILASAKCRSGRDIKLKSPVLETKFSHESYDRSPSPINKTSEGLSTLTSAVSAIANKGDNRRRNKFILESDSDTDSEKNIRLRKSEYKNTRLKRNSSSCNKQKQNEVISENGKTEQHYNYDKEDKTKDIKKTVTTNGKLQNNDEKLSKLIYNRKEVDDVYKSKTLQHRTSDVPIPNSKRDDILKENTKVDKQPIMNGALTALNSCIQTFRLRKGSATGVGLILAGGTDCEAKDVTVHRVLAEGIAAKAGIKRGSKVRSINGNLMSGLTHAQSVSILKEQRAEVVIEIENENVEKDSNTDGGSEDTESKGLDSANKVKHDVKSSRSVVTVLLEKIGGGAGLGFGLDGGRDSPQGDRPLTIKKLFAGGAAAQNGRVMVGAELLSAGGQSMEGYTRTQAWAALKALPAGQVALVLRNPSNCETEK